MSESPPTAQPLPRAITFFDGQNLYYAARESFGYEEANYDPFKLAHAVCNSRNWKFEQLFFYTGVPDAKRRSRQHGFWTAKLRGLSRKKAIVFSPTLRYRDEKIRFDAESSFQLPGGRHLPCGTELYLSDGSRLPFGCELFAEVGKEKGVDVRIAVDLLRLAVAQAYDVAVIFSQDQDLAEAAKEVRTIAQTQGRMVQLYSAFPTSRQRINNRPITHTGAIPIERTTYDPCLDPTNYWPRTH